ARLAKKTIENAEKSERLTYATFELLAQCLGVPVEELVLPDPSSHQKNQDCTAQVWTADLPTPGSPIFVGRDDELALLDTAWDESSCHIVTVVGGWGGGKSSLIHEWLKRLATKGYRCAEWVVGWSFRGQGREGAGAGDNFFQEMLTYFNDPDPDSGLEHGKAI